jgi:chromosome segregation protein
LVEFNKLRVSGFKSFVDATELVIEPGLTGVVGPNGCGKSNLVEALRWAMGETSAKQMRGGEMDEVIFGGTRDRPARNIAEVSLILGNQDRKATAQFNEYDELEVTRRIEREKGSLYRVNGREVRARDVQLLFADVATGARSTALVSQGRIGAIINAKPAQRRHLLEEAAGITGLHSRRHEAELRLQAAEGNLTRLSDVITQLEAQLETLKKQARQAVRYRTVSESIRAAEALVLTIKRTAAVAELAAAREALAEIEVAVAARTGEAAAAATAQAEAAAAMPALRQTEAEAAAKRQALAIARDKLDEELERVARAREAAETRLAQIKDDIARETARLADADEAIARLGGERADLDAATAAEAAEGERAREALKAAAKAVEAVEQELALLNKQLAETEANRARVRQQLSEADLRRQRAERRLADIGQQIETARQSALAPEVVGAEEGRAAAAETAAESARTAWEAAEQARMAAQARYDATRDAQTAAAAAHTKLQAEAVALEELLAEPRAQGAWAPIIDTVTVESGFEAALGAALGDDLSAAGDDTAPVRWSLLPPFLEPAPLPPGARPLSEVVRAPARLARRLSQVGIVADAAAGAALQERLRPGQRLVTAGGDLWRWDGYVAANGAPTAAATRLKQRNRLKDVRAQMEATGGALREADQAADAAKRAVAAAQGEEADARAAVRSAETARNQARDALAVLRQKVAALQSRLLGLEDNRAQLQAEHDDAAAQIAAAQARLAELGDGTDLRDAVDTKNRGLAGLRQDLMEARAVYDALARQAEDRARRLNALAGEIASWTSRRGEADRQIAALAQRQRDAEAEIAALAGRPAEISAQRASLMDQLGVAEFERRRAADALSRGETDLAEADKALKQAEHALGDAREERVRRESAVAQATQTLAVVDGAIGEKIGCAPEAVRGHTRLEADEEPPALEQAEKRLQRLVSERDNLGAINLRAEQESNELAERIQGLVTERDDLIAAIARLREGIAKLNKEGRDRLLKSFNEVNGHFANLFTRLFGGGRAHLTLTEAEDPLEAGLEIMASPPGKRLGNLGLLSGGEQALTALALLFAVFMTNPAPICVLDEVDAPLDDANVDRFCTLLTDIANQTGTRALVVTHHRMTMARMDRLFGVTMAERGVSRLVSVDLRAAEELRESAA